MLIPQSLPVRYGFVFGLSFLLSIVLVPLFLWVAKRFNIMDEPNHRKVHLKPIPRLGGPAIFISFAAPMVVLLYYDNTQKGIVYGAFVALLIGLFDDLFRVSAVIKLIALFALTLLIWRFGVITSFPFHHYFGLNDVVFNLILTMLWLTGVTSALNALDHMDGLAGGVSLIAALAYFSVSIQTGQFFWGLLSIALAGSLIGYLCYNWHPAKIFMGDSGSFFLGFSLASIGIMGGWSKNPVKSYIIPVAILSLPIFDLLFVIVTRRLNGTTHSIVESIKYCGKDHIGHRLVNLGFSQSNAVRFIYLISATIAISALTIRYTKELESFLLLIQIVMMYIILVIIMKPSGNFRLAGIRKRNSDGK